jgi:TPR repeat protein
MFDKACNGQEPEGCFRLALAYESGDMRGQEWRSMRPSCRDLRQGSRCCARYGKG